MLNPDVDELKVAYEKAAIEPKDVAPADRAYDTAEEEVEALRAKADILISDIEDELRFNLRKKDPSSQRRIIKSYGIEIMYNNEEGSSSDEESLDLI